MHPKTVDKREEKLKEAVAGVVMKTGLKKLPSDRTTHLMAKAAVTAYEAAVVNQRPEERT